MLILWTPLCIVLVYRIHGKIVYIAYRITSQLNFQISQTRWTLVSIFFKHLNPIDRWAEPWFIEWLLRVKSYIWNTFNVPKLDSSNSTFPRIYALNEYLIIYSGECLKEIRLSKSYHQRAVILSESFWNLVRDIMRNKHYLSCILMVSYLCHHFSDYVRYGVNFYPINQ